jgi:hypothetical protein
MGTSDPKPVLLATPEAKIGGITVGIQPKQIVHKTLSWKNPPLKKVDGVT